MAGTSRGPLGWSMERDDEGQRTYTIQFGVEALIGDGPQQVLNSSGLPAIGSTWSYGNDVDNWAFCTPYVKIVPAVKDRGEQVQHWVVEFKFSTLPIKRCQDINIENPLAEPQKISGSFTSGEKEITKDRNDNTIKTTAHDVIKLKVPESLPTVRISQNVLSLGLDIFSPMLDNVNTNNMWGLTARKIRLGGASWERKFYGVCTPYYTRTFEFEVNPEGWDEEEIPNRSKKHIRGGWNTLGTVFIPEAGTNINNPNDFVVNQDKNGNPTETWLDPTTGGPTNTENFLATVEYADESNFFTLGVPTVL